MLKSANQKTAAQPQGHTGLQWLARLRWAAAAGQLAAAGVVRFWLESSVPVFPITAILLVTVASNLWLAWYSKQGKASDWLTGPVMALDLCLLTALLYWTGGPSNPFSVLYLVHVTLSAVMLPPRWTWALAALSVAGFGTLFFWNVPLGGLGAMHGHHHEMMGQGDAEPFSLHLQGMWMAFAVTAGLIAWFVVKISEQLRERDRELASARDLASRNERLAALATLAAGAAHELGSPLATIAVAAGELDRAVSTLPRGEDLMADTRLIRLEVKRCREILDRLGTEAGEAAGEARSTVVAKELVYEALRKSGADGDSRVGLSVEPFQLAVPPGACVQALSNLIRNALDAAGPSGKVEIEAARSGRVARFLVRDNGQGMTPEVLARAGEPFFTTKPAGRGMGLGLFLVRTLAERLGGALDIDSEPGRGTMAVLSLPVEAAAGAPL